MADLIQNFKINECKCSETGANYAPQVYVDGTDNGRAIQFWFTTRPGVTVTQVDELTAHMRRLLCSCHVQITKDEYAHAGR